MLNRRVELSWLGAEALPGDLAGINRVYQAWLDAAARHEQIVREIQRRECAATAVRWMTQRSSRSK